MGPDGFGWLRISAPPFRGYPRVSDAGGRLSPRLSEPRNAFAEFRSLDWSGLLWIGLEWSGQISREGKQSIQCSVFSGPEKFDHRLRAGVANTDGHGFGPLISADGH